MARKEENASQPRPHRVRRVIAAILKVLGTLLLVALLTTLVLACLFALYVKNDLSSQVDFSIADFSLDGWEDQPLVGILGGGFHHLGYLHGGL